MTSTILTDLSTDILRIIFSFVAGSGNDIEHLARTNRLLRHVSVPFVQKHRYGSVNDWNPCTVPRVLRDLILDPHVTQHVKSMEITKHVCWSNRGQMSSVDENKYMALLAANREIYREAVKSLIPEQSQEVWLAQIKRGNDDPLKALLILKSPNMTSIDWEVHDTCRWTNGQEGERMHYFFDYLHQTQPMPHLRPPINLESLSIHMHNANSSKEVLDISEILPLLTLPKLSHLTVSDVQGPFLPFRTPLANEEEILRTSPLKVLEIKHSCLSAAGLNAILSRVVALESLECRISDNDMGYSSGHTDSLCQLLKAIEINTAHSLKTLNLIGNDTHGIIGSGYTTNTLPTLSPFTSLTHLKLNPRIFTTSFIFTPIPPFPPIPPSPPQPSPEIASLMPPNLEILEMKGLVRTGEIAAKLVHKLQELLAGKEDYLPGLGKIVVRDVGGEYGGWGEGEKVGVREDCVGRGVEGDFRCSWEI